MFTIFFGVAFANWLDNLFKNDSQIKALLNDGDQTQFVNQIDEKVMSRLREFLEVFEGYHDKAYNLNDGRITIGYGTTTWLNVKGQAVRNVRMGDTITRDEAKLQVIYFFNAIIPSVKFYMGQNNLSIHRDVMVALLNFCYMGGTGFMTYDVTKRILNYASNNTNKQAVADYLVSNIINWLKSINFKSTDSYYKKGYRKKYQIFGLGWSRRVFASSDLVKGINRNKSYYDNNMKKPY